MDKQLKTQEDYQTIKINKTTHHRLKVLAALTRENMIDLVDRLITEEEKRIKEGKPSEMVPA